MSKLRASGLVIAILSTACGPSSKAPVGREISPLTADQKATVVETITSLGRVESAASTAAYTQASANNKAKTSAIPSPSPSSEPSTEPSPFPSSSPSPYPTYSFDESQLKMSVQLIDDCKVEQLFKSSPVSKETDPNPVIDFSYGLKATGTSCPIALDQALSVTGAQNRAAIESRMSYSVQNEAYRGLNDIDRITYRATGDMSVTLVTASSGSAAWRIDGSGAIHSQKQGELQIQTHVATTFEGEEKGDRTEVSEATYRIDFATFSAELKSSSKYQKLGGKKISDEQKYYFNNAEITRKEFRDILSKGGTIFESFLSDQLTD